MGISVLDLVSEEVLFKLRDSLLEVYDLVEESTKHEYHNSYSFGCCLYALSCNALQKHFNNSDLIQDLSANSKLILKVVDSPLYLRVLTKPPSEYRRTHRYGNDIERLFNLDNKQSIFSYDLFEDNSKREENFFGMFFYEKNLESDLNIRLQIFDSAWNLQDEWSSDTVQDINLDIDEAPVSLPEPKLLAGGNKLLTPVKPVVVDKKKSS